MWALILITLLSHLPHLCAKLLCKALDTLFAMVRLPPSPPPSSPSSDFDGDTIQKRVRPAPKSFILPDLVSHCDFPLTYNPHGDEQAALSDRWLDKGCPELSPKARRALYGLKAGELTAFCYPSCDAEHLRVVDDFMNYLFHLDNISDGMMESDTMVLSDTVMNALWYPEAYRPSKEQPVEEISAGKLAREYVVHISSIPQSSLLLLSFSQARCLLILLFQFLAAMHRACWPRRAGALQGEPAYVLRSRPRAG